MKLGMKEPYEEGPASRLGPEPYAGNGNVAGVALGMGTRRPAIELRKKVLLPGADLVLRKGRRRGRQRYGELRSGPAESETLCMRGDFKRENREILSVSMGVK